MGVFGLGVVYVITGAVGVVLGGERPANLRVVDPALAMLEVLIILAVLLMVVMMASVHACAPPRRKTYSGAAFAFMVLLAGVTSAIHFVELTVVRRIYAFVFPVVCLLLALLFRRPDDAFAGGGRPL